MPHSVNRDKYLAEIEAALQALREEEVDAVVGIRHVMMVRLHEVEAKLRESEERFRTLANHMSQLAWMADAKGEIVWYNRRWCEYTGVTSEQLLTAGWTGFQDPNEAERLSERLQDAFDSGQPLEEVVSLRGEDGAFRSFLFRAAPIYDDDGSVDRWLGTYTDITARLEAEDALRRSHEELERRVESRTEELEFRADQLSRLASELTIAEQRERRRLAALLHDHLQQSLVAVKLMLRALSDELIGTKQKDSVEKARHMIDEAVEASRNLTSELAPPILYDRGLAAGFEWLARRVHNQYELHVELDGDPKFDIDRGDIRTFVFQSVRELLFNVVKHAGVNRAKLAWCEEETGSFCIEVRDDGKGFDAEEILSPDRFGRQSGLGLSSIRGRLSLLGGRFIVESERDSGSRFILNGPMGQEVALSADSARRRRKSDIRPAPDRFFGDSDTRIRLLLADDHKVLRQGLASAFADVHDMLVVGEASDGEEAVTLARELGPDVVLMDFSMPKMNGVEATREIRELTPHVQVIGLSMYENPECAATMFNAGAVAYATKTDDFSVILETIRAARRS